MEYTKQEECLQLMNRKDFKNMSKVDAISIISKLVSNPGLITPPVRTMETVIPF